MRNFIYLFLLAINSLPFYSCSTQKDASDVQVVVTPDSLVLHSVVENIMPFRIKLTALKEPINRFQILQRTAKTGLITLVDTVLNTQSCYYDFQYTVSKNTYERKIELSFIAKTASDYSISTKYILLDSINIALKESSAHVMYGANTLVNNAFSINRREVVSFPLDSALSEIYDYRNKQISQSILGCEWRSATEKRFSRFNDFNYAEATVQSLQASYANASKKTTINQLKANDVILIGDLSKAIAVLKIIAIFDEEGYVDDRYVFNVKYIE